MSIYGLGQFLRALQGGPPISITAKLWIGLYAVISSSILVYVIIVDAKNVGFYILGLLFAGILVALTILAIERGPSIEEKKREQGEGKEEPFLVSERYAEEIHSRGTAFSLILVVCFFITLFMKEDYIASGLVAGSVIAILGFSWLTDIRAERGWFADNRYEVLELLQFIIAKTKSGGLPPGSRVSRHSSAVVQLRTSPSGETVGSTA